MFLNNLNYKQKKVFLGMAKTILVSDDGKIDEAEENYLRSICSEMSLGFEDNEEIRNDKLKEMFSTDEEARLVLVELIALAYSNGEYHENEKKYIYEILKSFGFENSILVDIEKIVKTFFEMQQKIIDFIAPNEV